MRQTAQEPQVQHASPEPIDALRQATQALHAQLDSHLPLARPGAGGGDYLDHLRVVQPWLAALSVLTAPTGYGGGYAQLAARDLQDLEVPLSALKSMSASMSGSTPAPLSPAQSADTAFSWGAAYVVEGSQLGGQVLYRRLREPLAPLALRYLQGRGDTTGAHWSGFVQALRTALVSPEDVRSACSGAVWAFQALLARFRGEGLMP